MSPRQKKQPNQIDEGKKAMSQENQQEGQTEERTPKRSKERIQFDFSVDALERLDYLKNETGASTRAEVIRQSLRLYEWFITEVKPEHTITITDTNKEVQSTFKAKLLHNSITPDTK